MKSIIFLLIYICFLQSSYSQVKPWVIGISNDKLKKMQMNSQPEWSPDGKKITFISNREGNATLYLMNSDGSDIHKIVDGNAVIHGPNFSPDGSQIVFELIANKSRQIYKIDSDGTNLIRLTPTTTCEYDPRWSPNGTKIAFHSDRDSTEEIYLMNTDGSDPVKISRNTGYNNSFPQWSPDGSKLTYMSVIMPNNFRNSFFDLKQDTGKFLFSGEKEPCTIEGFSIDGNTILYKRQEKSGFHFTVSELLSYDINSGKSTSIKKHLFNLENVCYANSDSLVMSVDGGLSIMDIKTRKMRVIFKGTVTNFHLYKDMILFETLIDNNDICIIKTDGTGFLDLTK